MRGNLALESFFLYALLSCIIDVVSKEVFGMIDFTLLPSSSAIKGSDAPLLDKNTNYTSMTVSDEIALYNDLNARLIDLEKACEIDADVLQSITDDTSKMVFRWDEKEELLLRINWLNRLSKVQEEIGDVATYDQAKKLRGHISSCQTSPLKKQLQDRLDDLLAKLPQEEIEKTATEKLMEFAIENTGDDFINLGRAGREDIVSRLFEQFGGDVPIGKIQEEVTALEQRVARLAEIEDAHALQTQLEALPLSNYPRLSSERKQLVAEQLIDGKKWKRLASLDRLVRQLDAKLSAAEEQEMMKSMESGFATALDFNRLGDFAVQIR